MLTIFNGFRVPGVPHVDIFRDADDPNMFHLLPDRPRIATDAVSGDKLFSYSLIARDVDIVFASTPEGEAREHQVGYLTTTVDLSVSQQDWLAIESYLRQLLKNERLRPSIYNRLFDLRPRSTEPKIGYANTWRRGTVRIDLLEGLGDTFKRASSQEVPPSLHGTCSAALWATFGAEGSQLLWDALHPDDDASRGEDGALPLQANIRYELEGIARLPELKVTVDADGSRVYEELRKRTRVYERSGGKTFKYPQISELTKSLVQDDVIVISWKDYGIPSGDPDADEIKEMLQSSILSVVTEQLTSQFFNSFEFQGIQEEDLGETFTHTHGGKPGNRLWLNEYKEEFISDIHLSLDYSSNVTFRANPQTSLLATLTPEEIDRHVQFLDVGNPEVQVLAVQVETNADFEADRIANITATLEYDEWDTASDRRLQKTESFVFRGPQDRRLFQVRMARDAEGRLLDRYSVRARIHYRAVSQRPADIELKHVSDRALTLSYDRLGYVKVEVSAGDVDWQQIGKVFVDFEYVAAAGRPDAKGTVQLTSETRLGAWTASKHGKSDNQYRYRVRYIFHDGREIEAEEVKDQRGQLVIHDTLVGRLRKTFDAVLTPAHVNAVNLRVRYENPPSEAEEQSHTFTATGSWEYVRSITEGAPQDLWYRYIIEYGDSHIENGGWKKLAAGELPDEIIARRYPFKIYVDGEGLDWSAWRRAAVEIRYHDEAHDFSLVHDLFLKQDEAFVFVEILAFSPTARGYDYKATLIPRQGEPVEVSGQTSGLLLLDQLI